MDSPFIYYKPATGKRFIGRKKESEILANLLGNGESVVIYEPPKAGKHSLIQQTFFNMRITSQPFTIGEMSLLSCRTVAEFLTKLGSTVMRLYGSTPSEYAELTGTWLAGTHFIFDPDAYATKDTILSLNWDVDDDDIRAALSLPYRIAAGRRQKCVLLLNDFQNIMLTGDGDKLCTIFEEVMKTTDREAKQFCGFIFCGSQVNAMKEIFDVKRYFFRQVNRVQLSEIDSKEIIDCVVRGFLVSGKVLDKELMLGVCKLFRNDIGYVTHFAAICDSLSKGYIMEPVLIEALDTLISIHEPRFIATMNDLTTFQVSLLKAVIDGHKKFSSAEVIQQYGLNSSANVRRLKDALCKKEILTFNEQDEPVILDPLFEYWVGKFYFDTKK